MIAEQSLSGCFFFRFGHKYNVTMESCGVIWIFADGHSLRVGGFEAEGGAVSVSKIVNQQKSVGKLLIN